MFGRQLGRINLSQCEYLGKIYFPNSKRSKFTSQYDDAPDPNVETKEKPSLKQWRPHYDMTTKLATKLKIFDRGGRPSTDFLVVLNAPWDLSRSGITRWWKRKSREFDILDQKFSKERHEILGSNLAAAHFLVHRGAKVKFSGRTDWVERDENREYNLPGKFEPDYVIEAIDVKGINIFYEGLANLQYLYDLKFLSFKGCKTIDDWCLDRISSLFPRLEHLDVSNCEKVTERGLEALYRMQTLKTLVVTNWHNSPAFELTCLMLEDCNPNLKCEIKLPEVELKTEKLTQNKIET